MAGDPAQRTSATLLGLVQQDPADEAAWSEFVRRYTPCILSWCRQWRLQEADAQDVAQDVLLKLAQKIQTFRYDPSRSFRAWLKTLTHHAWRDFLESRQRAGAGAGDTNVIQRLNAIESRDDLARRLEEEFDRELLEEAMRRVRGRVAENTWEAFRLLVLEGRSGAEAADRLGMQVSAAFVARHRVQNLIQEELQMLEGPVEP